MRKISFSFLILLFVLVGCNQQPDFDISTIKGKAEDYFRQLDEIETTAASFDGNKDIKFRLMVEGTPTEEQATVLFKEILDSFKKYSKHQEIWEYYNGYFDIKNYDDGVIYDASKVIDEELKVISK
ncbi:hypothetical protein [Aquibacillus saliphilus]|uniref:hypothetical protein n=1 Tax=Aquibacillus saliphilus TaxID=1909422 RepID=UPI001CF043E0|nr:hypothetical protein [Aquibacillus saliphilus]